VVVRPSGTEPKLKAYIEVVGEPGVEDLSGDRARCAVILDAVRYDLARLLALDA
jgi:phosphomannomutase